MTSCFLKRIYSSIGQDTPWGFIKATMFSLANGCLSINCRVKYLKLCPFDSLSPSCTMATRAIWTEALFVGPKDQTLYLHQLPAHFERKYYSSTQYACQVNVLWFKFDRCSRQVKGPLFLSPLSFQVKSEKLHFRRLCLCVKCTPCRIFHLTILTFYHFSFYLIFFLHVQMRINCHQKDQEEEIGDGWWLK